MLALPALTALPISQYRTKSCCAQLLVFTAFATAPLTQGIPPKVVHHNVVILLVAAGSAGYGFWYRLLSNPEGPSMTTTSCPKFTPLTQFKDNVAHSNMFYGFRIHPEYYPIQRPCDSSTFQQVPAVFDGLISYKNGVKGAIATQVSHRAAQI